MRDILLYDEIGPGYYGMLDGKWMASELKAAKNDPVRVRINSPGGSVFEAQAMYTLLTAHKPGVTVHVDSIAASAASFVMLAGQTIEIADNAMVMIHNAWGLAIGNAGDMRSTADLLDKIDGTLVDQYVARTKQDPQQIRDWMAAETWMTAKEAKDRGFADAIAKTMNVKACIREGQFKNTPAHLLAPENYVSPAVQAAAMRRRLAVATAMLDNVR